MAGSGPTVGVASALMAVHPALTRRFQAHQFALLEGDLEAARSHLAEFDALLRLHMADEEELVLPLYEARACAPSPPPGGAPDLFHREHRKLRGTLQEIVEAQTRLKPDDLEGRLALLEMEYAFKQLLAHHDAREGNILYPTLDEILSPSETSDLIRRLRLPPDAAVREKPPPSG